MSRDRIITVVICLAAIIFAAVVKFLPFIYFNIGKNCLQKQDYICAYTNLKKAYKFDNNNKDYRYFYVKSMANLSPSLKIQKEVFAVSSSKSQDSAQIEAQSIVNGWKQNVLLNIGDNYIEQAPFENGIIRWDSNKFPLKVSVKNKSKITLPNYYYDEVLRAFNQWQVSTNFIKFRLDDKNPDIEILIEPTPANLCNESECRYVVGFTTPKYRGNFLNKMIITLYTKDPNGNFFSDKELYNTILHEIGHALGIMGHSYSSEDLMYMSGEQNKSFYAPYRSSFQYLSSKDINTIKLLYKLVPTITNTPLNELNTKGLIYAPVILGTSDEINTRKLKEAQNYVKKAPNLANGYIDLGIAYANLNKYKDAVKAMQKAYELSKTNEEKYMSSYNLAAMYLSINDTKNALIYAQIAKQISNTEEIKDLIMNINHQKSK